MMPSITVNNTIANYTPMVGGLSALHLLYIARTGPILPLSTMRHDDTHTTLTIQIVFCGNEKSMHDHNEKWFSLTEENMRYGATNGGAKEEE
jgi:hypothetical protein